MNTMDKRLLFIQRKNTELDLEEAV